MKENNNNFEQKDVQINSQEKIEEAKKSVTWRVVEALNNSSEEIVNSEKNKEINAFSGELNDLKEKFEKSISKTSIKIPQKEWDKFNANHDHKRIEQQFANTSTGEFLRGIHEELRMRKFGAEYSHLINNSDIA